MQGQVNQGSNHNKASHVRYYDNKFDRFKDTNLFHTVYTRVPVLVYEEQFKK